jgi:hypothetical protein
MVSHMLYLVPFLSWAGAVLVGHKIGEGKNRTGWAWGLFLGWLGVIILACIGPGESTAEHKSFRLSNNSASPITPSAGSPTAPPPNMPPAGWYADPTTSGRVRYWDGLNWTTYSAAPESGESAPPLPA